MLITIYIAIFAVVFCEMLITEGNIFAFYGQLIERLPLWLQNPLGGCPKCMAGQIALWGYILLPGYKFLDHIIFIVVTIFVTEILTLIYGKLQM